MFSSFPLGGTGLTYTHTHALTEPRGYTLHKEKGHKNRCEQGGLGESRGSTGGGGGGGGGGPVLIVRAFMRACVYIFLK